MGKRNEILFAASRSHDQDGHHAHIWKKSFKILPRNQQADFHETWYVALGTWPIIVCYTPGIYADGYIVFAFPFVRSSVRMFVSSFVRGICVKVLR